MMDLKGKYGIFRKSDEFEGMEWEGLGDGLSLNVNAPPSEDGKAN
jgi:hypothetical protein